MFYRIVVLKTDVMDVIAVVFLWFNEISQNTVFNGVLSSLRQFLATESPLKMMKNAFYFTSEALFGLKIFKFLSFWSCI